MTRLAALAIAGALLAGDALAQTAEDLPQIYLLRFNRWGELTNRDELDLAVKGLRGSGVDRVWVVSYGWANDGEASYGFYHGLVSELRGSAVQKIGAERVAVIGVGWDSAQTGFRRLFNDAIPLPMIADALAFLPDRLFFPISFWSKAAMADRIGMGGLRSSLNELFAGAWPEGERHPEVLLLGHSFGTRIVSGLVQERLLTFPLRAEPFRSAHHVSGALLFQPAAVLANLHEEADYPIIATYSSHDHANGFLFPVANLVLNAYAFTAVEGAIRASLIEPVDTAVARTAGTVGGAIPVPLPGGGETPEPSRARKLVVRSLAEILAIPASVLFTVTIAPLNYTYTQVHGLVTRPVDHLMDSLAQLPLVEIPVHGLDRLLDREVPWGSRHKGFFEFGALLEPAGRLIPSRFYPRGVPDSYSPEELFAAAAAGRPVFPKCGGVFAVDAREIVRRGPFGDLENPWRDFTLGWLDPLGAHGDYRSREITRIVASALRPGACPPAAAAGD